MSKWKLSWLWDFVKDKLLNSGDDISIGKRLTVGDQRQDSNQFLIRRPDNAGGTCGVRNSNPKRNYGLEQNYLYQK